MCAKVGIYIYTQNTHLHKFAKFWGAVIRRKTLSIGDGERGDCAKKRLRALKKGHKKGANCGMGSGGQEKTGVRINTCKISLQTKGKKTLRIQRKVPE